MQVLDHILRQSGVTSTISLAGSLSSVVGEAQTQPMTSAPASVRGSQRTPKLDRVLPGLGLLPLMLAPLVLLAACEGPNEKAGAAKDKAAAAAVGVPYKGDGPNEQIGQAQDRAASAAREAREAEAASLRKQARTVEANADVEADRLEQQAEAIRQRAKQRAAPFEEQARSVSAQP